jgi:membrane protease YdiL (CAAX protease family)
LKIASAFSVLFVAYQLPEGVGQRLLGSFLAQAALLAGFFAVAFLVGRSYAAGCLRAYGLQNPGRFWRLSLSLFVIAAALKPLSVSVGVGLGVFRPEHSSGGAWPAAGGLAFALLSTFAPSIAEDMVTRGFWFTRRGAAWGPARFVLTSSAIYVVNHVFRLAAGPGEWIMLFTFGVAYGLAVSRFGSLWPAVGLHWGWNYGIAVSSAFWPYEVSSAAGSRAVAIGAHLAMAVLVLGFSRFARGWR